MMSTGVSMMVHGGGGGVIVYWDRMVVECDVDRFTAMSTGLE